MRLIALLAALVPGIALAGWVHMTATPPFLAVNGAVANLQGAHYEWYSGCMRPGTYEQAVKVSPTASIDIDGLPDTGLCYFRVAAVLANGVTGQRSEEAIFDFTTRQQIPSTPTTAPTVTWSDAPPVPPVTTPVDVTADLVFWSSQFNYTTLVAGTGLKELCFEILGGGAFDDMRLGNNVNVPTTPPLGVNNDALSAPSACVNSFTLPLNTAGDVDGTVTGVAARINGTSYPLTRISGSASSFPWSFSRRVVQ